MFHFYTTNGFLTFQWVRNETVLKWIKITFASTM